MTSNKKNIIITQIINIENVINALTKDFTPEEWEDEVNYLSIVKKSLKESIEQQWQKKNNILSLICFLVVAECLLDSSGMDSRNYWL